ncbi:hypothetical protein KIPB_012670, partial [Kipferlia bialata]
ERGLSTVLIRAQLLHNRAAAYLNQCPASEMSPSAPGEAGLDPVEVCDSALKAKMDLERALEVYPGYQKARAKLAILLGQRMHMWTDARTAWQGLGLRKETEGEGERGVGMPDETEEQKREREERIMERLEAERALDPLREPLTKQDRVYREECGVRAAECDKREMAKTVKQLKGLGNSLLGRFGLSLDNFKVNKGETGAYSIEFQQNQ